RSVESRCDAATRGQGRPGESSDRRRGSSPPVGRSRPHFGTAPPSPESSRILHRSTRPAAEPVGLPFEKGSGMPSGKDFTGGSSGGGGKRGGGAAPGGGGSGGAKKNAYCSFCRKSYRDVGPLVEGPGDVYICGECI